MTNLNPKTQSKPCGHRRRCLCAVGTALLALVAAGCGSDDDPDDQSSSVAQSSQAATPTVAVTTGIWADLIDAIDCDDQLETTTLLARGQDPHLSRPSAQMRRTIEDASVTVANGFELEGELAAVVEDAEHDGSAVLFMSHYIDDPLDADPTHSHEHEEEGHDEDEAHDEHDEEGHEEEGHDEHEAHDPHFWLDPIRVADGLAQFAHDLADVTGLADDDFACTDDYVAELREIDAFIDDELADVDANAKTIVTAHAVLGYFADRYELDVLPVYGSTESHDASATATVEVANTLRDLADARGTVNIIAASTENVDLAKDLAESIDGVDIVEVALEDLGAEGSDTDTYLGLLRSLARTVAAELS